MQTKVKEKLSSFFKFYRAKLLPFTLGIGVFLLFLSTLWHPFLYVMLGFLAVSMIFFNTQQIWCTTFFFLPFDGFLILFIALTIYAFLLLLIKYFIGLKQKKFKVYKWPLIITTAICVFFSCIYYGADNASFLQGILIIGILYYIYLVFSMKSEINARECFYYAIYGLLVSAVVGLVLYYIPIAKMFYFGTSGAGMVSLKDRIYNFDGTFFRLLLLCFHQNHLYPICAFILGFIVYDLLKPGRKSLKQVIVCALGTIASIAIGCLTLSKAFLILLVVIIVYAVIFSIAVYKKNSLKILIPIVIVLTIFICIFFEEFKSTLIRFLYYDGNLINKLTTGRAEIWGQFVNVTFSSVWKALFGVGIFTRDVVAIGTHSLYVALLYRFGFVGMIALVLLAVSYFLSKPKGYKVSFSWLPFIIIFLYLLIAVQEACIDERLFFLFLGLMLTFGKEKEVDLDDSDYAVIELKVGEQASGEENKEAEPNKNELTFEKPKAENSKEQTPDAKAENEKAKHNTKSEKQIDQIDTAKQAETKVKKSKSKK